jgi:hypothetical protein
MIIVRVGSLIEPGESVVSIRVVRDTIPASLETETIAASLQGMTKMAKGATRRSERQPSQASVSRCDSSPDCDLSLTGGHVGRALLI